MAQSSQPERNTILDDIRHEYARRTERYDAHTPGQRANFEMLLRRRHLQYRRMLGDHGLLPLGGRKVLDVGSGRNEWLVACRTEWGQTDDDLCGIELLPERIAQGQTSFPYLRLECGSADRLPWPDGKFDLVHQGMLLSSILDESLRQRIVAEMRRVTRDDGYVLWYDFVWNPGNRAAQGIPLRGVRHYFAGWSVLDHRRVTLAPPLARQLARIGEPLIDLVEAVRLLNFWQLVLLRKPA